MAQPLAERLRPKTLDDYIGQKHLVGPGAVLRKMIDAGRISSFILWGPPPPLYPGGGPGGGARPRWRRS